MLVCLALAFPSWLLGTVFPVVGGPIIAIVGGIIISAIFPRLAKLHFKNGVNFEQGIKYTSKQLLRYSVVLLGFSLNFYNVIQVGGNTLAIMLISMLLAFLVAFFGGKALKLTGNTSTLIGVGTAICGASAIAAAAPVVRAKDQDVSQSISTIFLFNIISALIFPAIGMLLHLSSTAFGTWAGVAITDTSSVVAAGTSWSSAMADGDAALQIATISKLTRALMIVPVCLVLAIYMARKHKDDQGGNFSFVRTFPWFVVAFAIAAVANTFLPIPTWVSGDLTQLGKFVIIMAMAAIGLSTNIKELFSNGIKPILLGASCWVVLSIFALVVVLSPVL